GADYVVHPALLDAALQSITLPARFPSGRAYIPASVSSLRTYANARPAWAVCRVRAVELDTVMVDFTLGDAQGRVVMEVSGFREVAESRLPSLLHQVRWKSLPPPKQSNGKRPLGPWLVLADRGGLSRALSERFVGTRCVSIESTADAGAQ